MSVTRIVIDSTTGTVLEADNLAYVELTEEELEKAEADDSFAFAVAHRDTSLYLAPSLLHALYTKDVVALARFMKWSVEEDNSGQLVLYTDVYPNGMRDDADE